MADGSRFLVMEFDGGNLLFAQATRDHPEATVDMISEPMEDEDGLYYAAVFLVKGLGEEAMQHLEKGLSRRYGPAKTLRRDSAQETWMGRIRMHASAMTAAGALVFNGIHAHWGMPWCHIEGGMLLVRVRVSDPGEAERLSREVREAMADAGVEAQVEVQDVAPSDFGVWKELVESSLGLAS